MTSRIFRQMKNKQKNLYVRLKKDRGIDEDDMDNVKAIRHEMIEFEHGTPWKWWKDGSDIEKHLEDKHLEDGELTETAKQNYLHEEIVDIWHFAIQEVLIDDDLEIESDELIDWWNHGQGFKSIEQMHEYLTLYRMGDDTNHTEQKQRGFEAFMHQLIALSHKNDMTIQDLKREYLDKNEENHERQDGEVDGREEYEAE